MHVYTRTKHASQQEELIGAHTQNFGEPDNSQVRVELAQYVQANKALPTDRSGQAGSISTVSRRSRSKKTRKIRGKPISSAVVLVGESATSADIARKLISRLLSNPLVNKVTCACCPEFMYTGKRRKALKVVEVDWDRVMTDPTSREALKGHDVAFCLLGGSVEEVGYEGFWKMVEGWRGLVDFDKTDRCVFDLCFVSYVIVIWDGALFWKCRDWKNNYVCNYICN
jgi:hypothetical protein